VVQEKLTKNNIVWQLPMVSVDLNNTGCVHGNAKLHAFVIYDDEIMSNSLCKKYSQWTKEYENINIEEIYSISILYGIHISRSVHGGYVKD